MKFIELLTIELEVLEAVRKNYVLQSLIESNNGPWFNEQSITLMTDHKLSQIPVFPYDGQKSNEFFKFVLLINDKIAEITDLISQEKMNGANRTIQEPNQLEVTSCSECLACIMRVISKGATNPKQANKDMDQWSSKTLQFVVEYYTMKSEPVVPSLKQFAGQWLNSSKLLTC